MDPFRDRLPPQDRDAERNVLGGILRDPDVLPTVQQHVIADNFYLDAHQKVYQALCDLSTESQPIDLVLLYDKLRKNKQLEDVGGKPYLVDLWEAVPTGATAVHHAKLVKDTAIVRGLIHTGNEILRDAFERTRSGEELVAQAERKLFALGAEAHAATEPHRAADLAREALDRIDRIRSGEEPPGLATGFADIDYLLGGMKPGHLVIAAARPSVGKSAFATAVALYQSRAGVPVLFASLEMGRAEVMERILAMRSGVPLRAIQSAHLDREQVDRVAAAATAFASEPFHFNETSPMSAAQLAALVRRQIRRNGVKLVVVDYLGLLAPADPSAPRVHQVGQLSRQLKELARTCSVPVLALCQLNRAMESRPGGKPMLADLRDSGEVEQDADTVLLLSRQKDQNNAADIHLIDVNIAKIRGGMTGEVTLAYRRPYVRFENAVA